MSITINRVAVTLPPKPHDTSIQSSQIYPIVCEIAERLCELEEIQASLAADFVSNLAAIATRSHRAFNITVKLLHSDYAEVLASYEKQAERRGVTKQEVHFEFHNELERIKRIYPVLYSVILGIRAQALNHEDPVAHDEIMGRAGTTRRDGS